MQRSTARLILYNREPASSNSCTDLITQFIDPASPTSEKQTKFLYNYTTLSHLRSVLKRPSSVLCDTVFRNNTVNLNSQIALRELQTQSKRPYKSTLKSIEQSFLQFLCVSSANISATRIFEGIEKQRYKRITSCIC
jgi:hypothetical protein